MSGEVNFQLYQVGMQGVAKTEGGTTQSAKGASSKDEVSQSEQTEEDSRTKGLIIPWLPPPYQIPERDLLFEFSLKDFLIQAQHETMKSIFEHWEKGIDQMNEEHRRQQLKEMRGDLRRFSVSGGEGMIGSPVDGNPAVLVAATSLLLISSALLGGIGGANIPGFAIINRISEAAINLGVLPAGLGTTLGITGGLFAVVAFYPAVAQAIRANQGQAGEIKDVEFAQNYLKNVRRVVNDPACENLILRFAVGTRGVTELDATTRERLLAVGKLPLLLTALALYYKIETGGFTSMEIGALITGEIELDADDPRRPILNALSSQLNVLPQAQRFAILEAFFEFIDNNPSIDDLLVLDEILRNSGNNYEYERISQNEV